MTNIGLLWWNKLEIYIIYSIYSFKKIFILNIFPAALFWILPKWPIRLFSNSRLKELLRDSSSFWANARILTLFHPHCLERCLPSRVWWWITFYPRSRNISTKNSQLREPNNCQICGRVKQLMSFNKDTVNLFGLEPSYSCNLHVIYCKSLQKHILIANCNFFSDTGYRYSEYKFMLCITFDVRITSQNRKRSSMHRLIYSKSRFL